MVQLGRGVVQLGRGVVQLGRVEEQRLFDLAQHNSQLWNQFPLADVTQVTTQLLRRLQYQLIQQHRYCDSKYFLPQGKSIITLCASVSTLTLTWVNSRMEISAYTSMYILILIVVAESNEQI